MNKHEKLLARIIEGRSDANVPFKGLCVLLVYLGFVEWVRGSHHIFRMDGIPEKINLQADGKNAKPYQVRQVRRMILQYQLGGKP